MGTSSRDPELARTLVGHRRGIHCAEWCPSAAAASTTTAAGRLVSGGEDGKILIWDIISGKKPHRGGGSGDRMTITRLDVGHPVVSLSCGGSAQSPNLILASCGDAHVRLFRDPTHKRPLLVFKCHQTTARAVDLNYDGSQFVTAGDDKTVKLWGTSAPNKFLRSFSGAHTNWLRDVEWSPASPWLLASGGDDGRLCVWDSRTATRTAPAQTLPKLKTPIRTLAWHPHCDHLIASGSPLRIWDLRTGHTVQYYETHSQPITRITFHSTGKLLATSSLDGTCKILDLLEGRVSYTLKGHTGPVHFAAFSPDEKFLATGGADSTILLWSPNYSAAPKNNFQSSQRQRISPDNFEPSEYDEHVDRENDSGNRGRGPPMRYSEEDEVNEIIHRLSSIGRALDNVSHRLKTMERTVHGRH